MDVRAGLNNDTAYYLALISWEGLSRPAFLEALWSRVSALSEESLVRVLLREEVVECIHRILSHQSGCALNVEEVQAAVERLLIQGD